MSSTKLGPMNVNETNCNTADTSVNDPPTVNSTRMRQVNNPMLFQEMLCNYSISQNVKKQPIPSVPSSKKARLTSHILYIIMYTIYIIVNMEPQIQNVLK